MSPKRRVGLLGGAFDPPHAAHVALARCALSQLGLDELRVLPTGQPWHRERQPTAAQHRVAMCRLAFAPMGPQVVVDDRETRRTGPTYTIDTVQDLRREYPDSDWFLIIGADQARAFQSWRDWELLLQLVHLVVAQRDPEAGQWQNTALKGAMALQFDLMDVSATQIREALQDGRSSHWLDPEVQGYIRQYQLYSTHHP